MTQSITIVPSIFFYYYTVCVCIFQYLAYFVSIPLSVFGTKYCLFSFHVFMALSSPVGSDLVVTLKEPVTDATPTGKASMVIDLDSPTKKPRTEGKRKLTSGTVNVFELMMEQSRAGVRKNVKQKSFFQHVSKVV
jgi:acyl-CoA hydrolase